MPGVRQTRLPGTAASSLETQQDSSHQDTSLPTPSGPCRGPSWLHPLNPPGFFPRSLCVIFMRRWRGCVRPVLLVIGVRWVRRNAG